jgi:hypothetical protein
VAGRRIHDHVIFLKDLQHQCTVEGDEAYAMFLDFEKAYDRVNWDFLFDTLETLNFGPRFIQWVQLLYRSPVVHLLVNGDLGPPIFPSRGVKQGDPMSCILFILTVEPLSQLLRDHDELGFFFSNETGVPAVSLLFADDTTLISSSLHDLERQLELVDEFCSYSGARLNRAKCKVLTLNSMQPVDHHPRLNIVPTGVPIRYLGILLGHALDDQVQINAIEDKFLASFMLWGCRARTLKGRQLLTSTMILSQLWHFTAVIPIPQATLVKWQTMVIKYVLGRKLQHGDKFIQLIHTGWAYHQTLGLKIPHIPSMVQYQRVTRMQLLVQSGDEPLLWTIIPKYYWQRCMVPFCRPGHWDALLSPPLLRTEIIRPAILPKLWRDSWTWWARLPLDLVTLTPPTLTQLMTMSIWVQRYPLFLVKCHNSKSTCLVVALRYHRTWTRHLAEQGLHSLEDVLTPTRHWPTLDEFQRLMLQYADSFDDLEDRPVTFRHSYNLLTAIAHKVWDAVGLHYDSPIPPLAIGECGVAAMVQGVPLAFPLWPRRYIKTICFHGVRPTKPHPMASSSRSTETQLRTYLRRHVNPTLAHLPPLYADVWWRILFRMMPVNYRYFFLQNTNPHIMECSYPGCSEVENERHAFFGCRFVLPLWEKHQISWMPLGNIFHWDNIINRDDLPVATAWVSKSTVITRLWALLVAITLRELWITRNHIKYQAISPPPIPVLFEVSLLTWSACIRRWVRTMQLDDSDRGDITAVLTKLKTSLQYAWFFSKYPRAFGVSQWHNSPRSTANPEA